MLNYLPGRPPFSIAGTPALQGGASQGIFDSPYVPLAQAGVPPHVGAPIGSFPTANIHPAAAMPPPRAPDRFNPAARAYSTMMLRRFGQKPRGDVTAQWRKFSAGLVAGRNTARAQSARDVALGTIGTTLGQPGAF